VAFAAVGLSAHLAVGAFSLYGAVVDLLFVESSIKPWGTEQHFAALAIAMAQRAHRVRCLMCAGSPLEAVLREAQVPVVSLKFRGSTDPRLLAALFRLIVRRRPRWLVTNDGKFYWLLVLLGHLIGARTALFRHWPNMPKKKLTRKLIPRLADRFIVVSQFQREHLRREGIDVEPISILYNPIDTARLQPAAEARARMRATLGVTESEVVIGYLGRMVADKGIFTLLDASERVLAQASHARMLWVGHGDDLSALRARVAQSAQRSRHMFLDWTAQVRDVYVSLDVAVVPSQYPDPCPRVPVEAQACGVPVVCSNIGGLPETFVPNVSGLLVEPEDAASLSAGILKLVRDPDLRRSFGIAGREWVCSRLSFERIAEAFEDLLEGPRTPGAKSVRPQTSTR
jgi:glycosyltransferase involved in cell wall biosynthesis